VSGRSDKIVSCARKLDDFIIDRLLQPGINRADWHLGINQHSLARICAVLGAGTGLIWVHRYDSAFTSDFWQDILCLFIMTAAAFLQIRAHEANAPRRPALARAGPQPGKPNCPDQIFRYLGGAPSHRKCLPEVLEMA